MTALRKIRFIGVLFTGYDVVDVKAARESQDGGHQYTDTR
jgi:lactate dehydrogenase-like 2-hydroxyacid dehydrogenase